MSGHHHPHLSNLLTSLKGRKNRPEISSDGTTALPDRSRPPPINYSTKPSISLPGQGQTSHAEPTRKPATRTSSKSIFQDSIASAPPKLDIRSHALQPQSLLPASKSGLPSQTNKFYANLFLGSQRSQIYPLPYVLKWSGRGLDINHTDETQQVFGPDPTTKEAQYFYNPVGIVSLSLTAVENPTMMELHSLEQYSVGVDMKANTGRIRSQIVRGSAFITAEYQHLTPEICSNVMIRNAECLDLPTCKKWRLTLEDGKLWLLYASGSEVLHLEQLSGGVLRARAPWSGIIQVAKISNGDSRVEGLFDQSCGTYPTNIILDGSVQGQTATYSFDIQKVGNGQVLMYALPHHLASFDASMHQSVYPNQLASQTNGMMSLVTADRWEMVEKIPDMSELAYCPEFQPGSSQVIGEALELDVSQDFDGQIKGDSMYFCGKALNKLAQMAILAQRFSSGAFGRLLPILERNVLHFVRNMQQFGLVYENTWGGIVSSQGFTDRGDRSDFGNTWYADHHYHWGYHISSVAIYLELCPDSQYRSEVVKWTEDLIRDVASPQSDQFFPAYRSMDWFVGHSWSTGLYESADGKDEESSSEDYHFTYACYLFSLCVGNDSLRDRSLIQMAVQRHSIQSYMLFTPDNTSMPPKIVPNCVSGIGFENKVDYTTWFGANKEFIHGIQVIPVTPITSYFRSPAFVHNEWNTKLKPVIDSSPQMEPGWRGLLYISLGMVEGEGGQAWKYFVEAKEPCDGGVSRAWYLAMISSVSPS